MQYITIIMQSWRKNFFFNRNLPHMFRSVQIMFMPGRDPHQARARTSCRQSNEPPASQSRKVIDQVSLARCTTPGGRGWKVFNFCGHPALDLHHVCDVKQPTETEDWDLRAGWLHSKLVVIKWLQYRNNIIISSFHSFVSLFHALHYLLFKLYNNELDCVLCVLCVLCVKCAFLTSPEQWYAALVRHSLFPII